MTDPDPADDADFLPLNRWSVPLDEPDAPPVAPPLPTADEPVPDLLRFSLDAEAPSEGFQPRLTRFGKAG